MPKLPALTAKKLIKTLERMGFELDHQTVSHRIYYHPISGHRAVIPYHAKDLPTGTLNSIVKQMKDIEILITTEKDAVKLEKLQIGNLSIFALEIDIHIKNPDILNKAVGLNA